MPETEMKFRLSISIPPPFRDINSLILTIMNYGHEVSKFLLQHILIEHQKYLLLLYLGKPRTGVQKVSTPWRCPRCGSQFGFVRRGWRSKFRTLKTSAGIVEFPLKNISCKKCGKTFSPFPEFWGLEPWQRISKEFSEKAVFLATQFSYSRSSNTLNELFDQNLAPITIHKLVQKASENVDCKNEEIDPTVLMFDDTKVPAGDKEYGADLLLGISLDGHYRKHNRNRLKKSIVSLDIDKGWRDVTLKLKDKYSPDTVISDGNIALKTFIKECFPDSKVQQCVWHLFKTSDHYLWMDGLSVPIRRPMLSDLSKLVTQKDIPGIKKFIKELEINGLKNTANFINQGLDDLFTYINDDDIPFRTTSPVEREMREINRRSDVGARWTVEGLSNLLNLGLAYEKNRKSWNNYWYDDYYYDKNSISIEKI